MQDKLSPRIVATIGGVLVGLGMLAASQFQSVNGYVTGFGVLAGAGIGFGYASATPPAVKWFPSAKTGMIAGIVVSGFGLASLYAAPLSKWLASTYSLQVMMMVLGIAFLIVVVGLAVASSMTAPSAILLIVLAGMVGTNYGSNLALFPSATKDFFGLKNFGMNYGLVFTAWGIGGFILAQFAARVYDGKIVAGWAGSYNFAFYTSAALLIVAAVLTFVLKAPHHNEPEAA